MDVKFYDSKGIIPNPGEVQQLYLERARIDLDVLQQFYQDIQEKKVRSISVVRHVGLDNFIRSGEYEVLDNPPMREYGFSELYFPTVAIASEVFSKFLVNPKEKTDLRVGAIDTPILYDGKNLSLAFVDKDELEKVVSQEMDSWHEKDDVPPILKKILKFGLTESTIKHEKIHSIRELAAFKVGYSHFEELVAYSTLSPRRDIWKIYFFVEMQWMGVSLSHPLQSIRLLAEYDYLREKVENGTAEKFPLPLLVRISDREFVEIVKQMESGKEIGTIIKNKIENKPKYSWRWELIAELCRY